MYKSVVDFDRTFSRHNKKTLGFSLRFYFLERIIFSHHIC